MESRRRGIGVGRGGGAQPLSQLAGVGPPERLQIHVAVAQLVQGQAEKRERAPRSEVHADHRGVHAGVDHEIAPERA